MIVRSALNLFVLVLACALIAACSSTPPTAQDANVHLGDTLHGRMVPGRTQQTFTFEGVESTLLDAYVRADENGEPAPSVAIHDPSGEPLDVAAASTSKVDDHEFVVRSLVLPKTGIYKVIVTPRDTSRQVFYTFKHNIRWASMPDRKAHISAAKPTPVYVAAPRRGLVVFSIKPDRGSKLVPQVQAVKDPWGGPALDKSQIPAGAPAPRVHHTRDGKMILTFTAPRPGMYTILAGAKPGTEGVGTLRVGVTPPKRAGRQVFHNDGAPSSFGVPGQPGAATPVRSIGAVPPPPPPPAPVPVDSALASR
ncbi:MAG: hypothetical protein QNJ90_03005 [Planctomycetota bacterium]|nr:hypothetical protein [Planctomycetota bacterium]